LLIKIPREFKIHKCSECGAELTDSDFKRCGVSLSDKPSYVFDYECGCCAHFGRYLLELKKGIEIPDALKILADLLKKEDNIEKGHIRSQLNKIIGVQDLLKLGGTDAPTEPDRYS
jgi:RNase P subunit RPR2